MCTLKNLFNCQFHVTRFQVKIENKVQIFKNIRFILPETATS